MLAILVAVALLVVLVLFLLFTPLELDVAYESGKGGRRRFVLLWLFGLVSADLTQGSSPERPERVPKKSPRKRERRRRVYPLAMLRSRGFSRGALRLLARIARAFRFHRLFARLRAGLDDPADTGLLCAWLLPPAAWIEARRPGTLEVVPDFTGAALELALEVDVSVTPARLLGPLVLFGLAPSTIFGLYALRTGRAR